jgi:hypothetical protein
MVRRRQKPGERRLRAEDRDSGFGIQEGLPTAAVTNKE